MESWKAPKSKCGDRIRAAFRRAAVFQLPAPKIRMCPAPGHEPLAEIGASCAPQAEQPRRAQGPKVTPWAWGHKSTARARQSTCLERHSRWEFKCYISSRGVEQVTLSLICLPSVITSGKMCVQLVTPQTQTRFHLQSPGDAISE